MDDSIVPPSQPPPPPVKSQNDSMMEKLAALLSGQSSAQANKPVDLPVADYVSLWKRALAEGRKCMELYDSDSKWKKPVLSREDFARMIFSDLLYRQREIDFAQKKPGF